MDEFDKYFEKASKRTEHHTHHHHQPHTQRKSSLHHDPQKSGKSSNQESYNSKRNKAAKSLHHLTPPICLITPDEDNDETSASKSNLSYQKPQKKRNSKDFQPDSLRVSLLDRNVRRHSINPEEITATKLEEINKLQQDDCLIVRSFLTSPKGLVDRGDSFKRRASNVGDRLPSTSQMLDLSSSFKRRLSDASKRASFHGNTTAATISDLINANASAITENDESICLDPVNKRVHTYQKRPSIEVTKHYSLDASYFPDNTPQEAVTKPSVKKTLSHELSSVVIMLGDLRVGKSSLITQFLSSEHLMGFDNFDVNSHESIISIYVDGVETQLNFIEADLKISKSLEEIPRNADCKAYLVVYSITDSASFHTACQLTRHLCMVEETGKEDHVVLGKRPYSVVMVANKGDLVRNRKVSEAEAREVCTRYECKYMEVSSALSHNVNELLVGLVHQIKLNHRRKMHESKYSKSTSRKSSKNKSYSSSSSNLISNGPSFMNSYIKGFKKMFAFRNKEDGFQCDNMQTL